MKDIQQELLNEKMHPFPNKSAIQFLQRVLDGQTVTKTEFMRSMVITPVGDMPNPDLFSIKCINVVRYPAGFNIQILNNGDYLYEVFDNQEADEMHTKVKSIDLKDVLSYIWRNEADKLFNKI
jgi:hypothetical protein